eukprot:930535_1
MSYIWNFEEPFRPNSRIAYNTIKSEVASETKRLLRDDWHNHRSNCVTKWNEHFAKWRIEWHPIYGEVANALDIEPNNVRMALISGHIGLNMIRYEKFNNVDDPYCQHPLCKARKTEES